MQLTELLRKVKDCERLPWTGLAAVELVSQLSQQAVKGMQLGEVAASFSELLQDPTSSSTAGGTRTHGEAPHAAAAAASPAEAEGDISDTLWVLMVYFSLVAAHLHKKQQGRSPITQQFAVHGEVNNKSASSSSLPGSTAASASAGSSSTSDSRVTGPSSRADQRHKQGQQQQQQPQPQSEHCFEEGMEVPPYHGQLLEAVGLSSFQPEDWDIKTHTINLHWMIGLLPQAACAGNLLLVNAVDQWSAPARQLPCPSTDTAGEYVVNRKQQPSHTNQTYSEYCF